MFILLFSKKIRISKQRTIFAFFGYDNVFVFLVYVSDLLAKFRVRNRLAKKSRRLFVITGRSNFGIFSVYVL